MDLVAYWQRTVAPFLRARFSRKDERGASLVEYALIVAVIAVIAIGGMSVLGNKTNNKLKDVGTQIEKAAPDPDAK